MSSFTLVQQLAHQTLTTGAALPLLPLVDNTEDDHMIHVSETMGRDPESDELWEGITGECLSSVGTL